MQRKANTDEKSIIELEKVLQQLRSCCHLYRRAKNRMIEKNYVKKNKH